MADYRPFYYDIPAVLTVKAANNEEARDRVKRVLLMLDDLNEGAGDMDFEWWVGEDKDRPAPAESGGATYEGRRRDPYEPD